MEGTLVIDKASVARYLGIIREIAKSVRLTDSHVHPFDVLYDNCTYEPNPHVAGVFSAGSASYEPPAAGTLELESPAAPAAGAPRDLVDRMLLLTMRRLYAHTGPQCWLAHANLAGIGRYVLLPVAQPGRTAETRLAEMVSMFGDDPRFLFGYSLPNTISADAVEADIRRAVESYNVAVLKVHPTLSGHDLSTNEGLNRINALLQASRKTFLPVILHGGLSPSTRYSAEACQQGTLENLAKLDLGATDRPIIIAHAGAFGYEAEELNTKVLSPLNDLLAKYDHLHIGTSALPAATLGRVLERVEPGRIVFGSDALYESSWKAAVKLYWALERKFSRPEDVFAQIAGTNPEYLFGKEV
ncbi:MAG: amidohydrolase family protein [Syntrophotaleaceae bacterium]